MAARRHLLLRAVVFLLLLACVGEAVPRYTVGNSISAYAGLPDAHAVALAAHSQARAGFPATLGRLLYPAERVSVWVHPGHCPAHASAAATPRRAYEATVQLYTLFNIPGPELHVRCGGRESSWTTT